MSAPTALAKPDVFIHGLRIHSATPRPWQKLFAEAGNEPHVPSWTGDAATPAATRDRPEAVTGLGVAEFTAGYARCIADLPVKPIVVGQSFGGLIAQKLLADGLVDAAVAISPAPIKGAAKLPLAQIRSALPVPRNPKHKTRAVALSARQFRCGFCNAIGKDEAASFTTRTRSPVLAGRSSSSPPRKRTLDRRPQSRAATLPPARSRRSTSGGGSRVRSTSYVVPHKPLRRKEREHELNHGRRHRRHLEGVRRAAHLRAAGRLAQRPDRRAEPRP